MVIFSFFFCKQTAETQLRRRVLRRLSWVSTVCLQNRHFAYMGVTKSWATVLPVFHGDITLFYGTFLTGYLINSLPTSVV